MLGACSSWYKAGRAAVWLLAAGMVVFAAAGVLLLLVGREEVAPEDSVHLAPAEAVEEPGAPEDPVVSGVIALPDPEAEPVVEPDLAAEEVTPPEVEVLAVAEDTEPEVTAEVAVPPDAEETEPEADTAAEVAATEEEEEESRALRLTGRAYDRESQRPIPGVEVELEARTIHFGDTTRRQAVHAEAVLTTDRDGQYEFEMEADEWVDHDGRFALWVQFRADPPGDEFSYVGQAPLRGGWRAEMIYAEGGVAVLDLPFERDLLLRGRVFEPDAQTPARGVSVEASGSTAGGAVRRATESTDADGEFEFFMPRNSIGHIHATSSTGAARTGFRMPGSGTGPDLRLVLAEYGSVEGRVLDPSGQPVAEAPVSVTSEPPAGGRIPAYTTSDENGRFSIARVVSGHVTITAAPPGYLEKPLFDSEPYDFQLEPVSVRSGITLRLVEGDSIPVLVVDRAGLPIPEVRLDVELGEGGKLRLTPPLTGPDGRILIEGIPPGGRAAMIGANHPNYRHDFVENVSPLDGEQVFRLDPLLNRELVVRWAETGAPVNYYSYYMLQKGWNEFDIDVRRGTQVVRSEDGRTSIENLAIGQWRVQVAYLDENGEATMVRGSVEFEVAGSPDEIETVEVLLNEHRTIRGTVVSAETGEAVPGAEVRVEPPALHDPHRYWDNRMLPGEQPIPLVYTSPNGEFEIGGLTAGRHSITVTRDVMRTQQPVDVMVSAERDPDPVEIALERGGVIFGRVVNEDNEPVPRVLLSHATWSPNYTHFDRAQYRTDAEGNYRMEGLSSGFHQIWLHPGTSDGLHRDSRQMNLDFGEVREVNFDYYHRILLKGEVYLPDDYSGSTNNIVLRFHPSGEEAIMETTVDGATMEYEVRLRPGLYTVQAGLPGRSLHGEGHLFGVAETPSEQWQNIRLDFAEADVVLVFPRDGDFHPGRLAIAPLDRHRHLGFLHERMNQEARRTVELMAGDYQATFVSADGNWRGESGPVQIGAGHENVFVLEMKRIQRDIPVGTWDPSTVSLHTEPHLFDATQYIQSSGTISLLVEYQSGRNAVETFWGRLYQNGEIVDTRQHRGWSGFEKWNNAYHLRLDGYDPESVYHVEIGLRADGGTDSHGTVYLSTN